jgi:hypothetical protein
MKSTLGLMEQPYTRFCLVRSDSLTIFVPHQISNKNSRLALEASRLYNCQKLKKTSRKGWTCCDYD